MNKIQHSKFNILYSPQRGSLLLELLVAISLLAIILSIGSQAVYVSLQSGKTSSESDVAMGLASEEMESVRAIADEKWQNIYNLASSTQYHTVQSGTRWATSTASEVVSLNGVNYTRYFVVNYASRDSATRMIDTAYNSQNDDPSTRQVTVTVSWNGAGSPITISDYFFRFRNKVCNQTDWSGGKTFPSDPAPATTNCPQSVTTYYNDDGNIDTLTTAGSLKLK